MTQPKQEQGEPVACSMCNEWEKVCDQHLRHIAKLKKKRTWVGLTDDEVSDLWHKTEPYYHENDFARAIEAKLKDKNL